MNFQCHRLDDYFPLVESGVGQSKQAMAQLGALGMTLGVASIGGLVSGSNDTYK